MPDGPSTKARVVRPVGGEGAAAKGERAGLDEAFWGPTEIAAGETLRELGARLKLTPEQLAETGRLNPSDEHQTVALSGAERLVAPLRARTVLRVPLVADRVPEGWRFAGAEAFLADAGVALEEGQSAVRVPGAEWTLSSIAEALGLDAEGAARLLALNDQAVPEVVVPSPERRLDLRWSEARRVTVPMPSELLGRLGRDPMDGATSPWKHLDWDAVREDLVLTLSDPDRALEQGRAPVCGPAAFLHDLAERHPEGFASFVRDAFANRANLPKALLDADPKRLEQGAALFVATGALKHLTNNKLLGVSYDASESSRRFAGLTHMPQMAEWFRTLHGESVTKPTRFGGFFGVSGRFGALRSGRVERFNKSFSASTTAMLAGDLDQLDGGKGKHQAMGWMSKMLGNPHWMHLVSRIRTDPDSGSRSFDLWDPASGERRHVEMSSARFAKFFCGLVYGDTVPPSELARRRSGWASTLRSGSTDA